MADHSDCWQQGGALDQNLTPFMAAGHLRTALENDSRRIYRILPDGRRALVATFKKPADAQAVVQLYNDSLAQIEQIKRDLQKLTEKWDDPAV